MSPRINVRDIASPIRWGAARPGMAWHHIIPFSLLREVWNRLVDQHIATALPEARTALRQYLLAADRTLPNLENLLDRMRLENTTQKRSGHQTGQPLSVAEALQLSTAAAWPVWNAIEGPRRRSDDPRDHYFDRFTSGLTPTEAVRMKAIEVLYEHLQRFVSAGPAPGSGSLRTLGQAMMQYRPDLACDFPIRYRPELWVDEGGVWRKRRDGERSAAAAK